MRPEPEEGDDSGDDDVSWSQCSMLEVAIYIQRKQQYWEYNFLEIRFGEKTKSSEMRKQWLVRHGGQGGATPSISA